jgi:hypothetical protein
MRLDAGRLESVLDDVKNARRVTRGETHIRHVFPCVTAYPCSNDFTACAKKPTVRRPAKGQPPHAKPGPFVPIAQSALQH